MKTITSDIKNTNGLLFLPSTADTVLSVPDGVL